MESRAGEMSEEKVDLGQNLGERQQPFQAGDNGERRGLTDSPETPEP